jgi:hypothetical protein
VDTPPSPPSPRSAPRRIVLAALCSLALLLGAAACNAGMDVLSFRYDRSIFRRLGADQWWDPRVSWRNKWRDGDPARGEAFPASSTALVFATDGWHLLKAGMLLGLVLAVIIPFTVLVPLPWWAWIGVALGMKLLFGLVFELGFRHVLIRD